MNGDDDNRPREPRFGELIGKVRRLHHDTVTLERPRPPVRPRRIEPARPTTLEPSPASAGAGAGGAADDDESSASDYHRPGLQRAVLRKLRRGHFAVQDELDLHGLTVREAGIRLGAYLDEARGRRLACVRIIHGKGLSSPGRTPVLKPQVARWLRSHAGVLAFTPARRDDGGDGAVYVLLRSRRD